MALSRLKQLDTFVFDILAFAEKHSTYEAGGTKSWLEQHRHLKSRLAIPETCLGVAEDFIVSCPSLRHVAFRVASEGRLLSYTRSQMGHAVMEGWDIFDGESWRRPLIFSGT